MRPLSVQTWKVGEYVDKTLYIYGLDHKGKKLVEFIFDEHVRLDGKTYDAHVLVNRVVEKAKLVPVQLNV